MGSLTNSEGPDKIPLNVAFHQGLHCLPRKSFLRYYCNRDGRIHIYTDGFLSQIMYSYVVIAHIL